MKKKKRTAVIPWKICGIVGILSMILLIGLDQVTKIWAIQNLSGKQSIVLIPGVLELQYLENRGMAFGMFEGKIPLFLIFCCLFFLAAVFLFIRIPKTRYYAPLFCILFLMFSGAAGNFIDRAVRGAVIDFIYVSLIDFPVFNLADIYVVSSGILLVLFVCLKYKEEDFDFLKRKQKR